MLKGYLKKSFPKATKCLADRYRWHLRDRHDMGQELRYHIPLRLAGLTADDSILEVGKCNYQTIAMSRVVRQVTVLDIGDTNRAVESCGPRNIVHIKGDVCSYPFPSDSFDKVFMMAVLEHIADDAAAVINIYRSLKPGGSFLVYVPDTGAHLEEWKRGDYPDHVRPGYYGDGLRDLLTRAGFEVHHCALGNGINAAVAGDIYYEIVKRFSLFRKLPYCVMLPFLKFAERDEATPYPYRWGLYCKAIKPVSCDKVKTQRA